MNKSGDAGASVLLEMKQSPVATRRLLETARTLGPLLQDEEMSAIMSVFARASIRISTMIESEGTLE